MNIALKEPKASEVRLPITRISLKHADGHIVTLFDKDKIAIFEPGSYHQKLTSAYIKPGIYTHLTVTLRIKDSYYAEAVSVEGELQDVSVTLSDYNDSDFITSHIEHPFDIKKGGKHHYRLVYDTQGSFKFAHSLSGTDENLVYSPHFELNNIPVNPTQQVLTPAQVTPSRQISPSQHIHVSTETSNHIPVSKETSNMPAIVYGLDESTIIIKAKGELTTLKQGEVTLIDAATKTQLTTDFIHVGQRIDINESLENIFIYHTHFLVKKNTTSLHNTQKTYDILSINDNQSIRLNNANLLEIDDSQLSTSMSDINATYWKVSGLYYKDSDGQSTLKAETADIIGLDNCTLTVDFSKEHNATLLTQIESSHTQLSFDSQTTRTAQFYLTVDDLNIDVPVVIDHILLLEGQYRIDKPERGKENTRLESETYIDQETLHISEVNKQFKRYFDNHQWLQHIYLKGTYSSKEQTFSAKNGAFIVSAADIDSLITQQILSPFEDSTLPVSALTPTIEKALIITLATALPIAAGIGGIITYLYRQKEINNKNHRIKTLQNETRVLLGEIETNTKKLKENIEKKKAIDLSHKELQTRLTESDLLVEELRAEGRIKDKEATRLNEQINQVARDLETLEQVRKEQDLVTNTLNQKLNEESLKVNQLLVSKNASDDTIRQYGEINSQLTLNLKDVNNKNEDLLRTRQELLGKIQQAKEDISTLQLEKENLEAGNNKQQQALSDLEETRQNQFNKIKEMENDIKKFEEYERTTNKEKIKLEKDLHLANSQLNETHMKIKELESSGELNTQEKIALQDKIDEITTVLNEANDNIKSKDESLYELNQELEKSNASIGELKSSNEDIKIELKNMNNLLKEKITLYSSLQVKSDDIERKLNDEIEEREKYINELENRETANKNQLDKLRSTNQGVQAELTELRRQRSINQIEFKELNDALIDKDKKIKELTEESITQNKNTDISNIEKDLLEKNIEKLTKKINDIQADNKTKDDKITELEKDLEDTKYLIEQLQAGKEELTVNTKELLDRLKEFSISNKELEERFTNANNALNLARFNTSELESEIKTTGNYLKQIKASYDESKKQLILFKDNNDQLSKSASLLKAQLIKKDERIDEFEKNGQLNKKEAEEMKKMNSSLSEKIDSLTKKNIALERAQIDLDRLKLSMESFRNIVDPEGAYPIYNEPIYVIKKIQEIYLNYNNIQQSILEKNSILKTLEERIEALEGEKIVDRNTISSLEKIINDLKESQSSLEVSKLELESSNDTMEGLLTEKETIIEKLRQENKITLDEKVMLSESQINLIEEINTMISSYNNVSYMKSELEEQLVSIQETISMLKSEGSEKERNFHKNLEIIKESNDTITRSLEKKLKSNEEAEKIRIEESEKQLTGLRDAQKKLQLENADLKEKTNELLSDINEKSVQAQNQDQMFNEYVMQIKNLEDQVLLLEKNISSNEETYQGNIANFEKEIKNQEKKYKELEEKLDDAKNSNNATLTERKNEKAVLESELSSIRNLLAKKIDEMDQYKREYDDIEKKLREAKENSNYLKQYIAELQINNLDLNEKVKVAKKSFIDVESKNNSLEVHLADMKSYQKSLNDLAIQIYNHIKSKSSQAMETDLSKGNPLDTLREINSSLTEIFLIMDKDASDIKNIEEEIIPWLEDYEDRYQALELENQRLTSQKNMLLEQLQLPDSEITKELLEVQTDELGRDSLAVNEEYATLLLEQKRSGLTVEQELLANVIEKQALEITEKENNIQYLTDKVNTLTSKDLYQESMIQTILDEPPITERRPDLWEKLRSITAPEFSLSIDSSKSLDSFFGPDKNLIPASGAQGALKKEVNRINEASLETDTLNQSSSPSLKRKR